MTTLSDGIHSIHSTKETEAARPMKHLKGGKIRSLVAIRSKEGTVYGSVSFLAMNRKDHPPLFQVLLRFHIVAGHNRLDQD